MKKFSEDMNFQNSNYLSLYLFDFKALFFSSASYFNFYPLPDIKGTIC